MRVTLSSSYQKMLLNMNRQQKDINRLNLSIASEKRMSAPKDDPLAWSQAMDIKQGLRELGTFQKNAEFATGWNQATTSALTQLDDLLTEARQVGIAAQSANSDDERAGQISSLEQIADQAMGIANTQYDNMYIFSGKSFSTAPFDETTLDYMGDTEDFEVRVAKNNRQTINLDGESVFITDPTDPSSNILKRIEALKTAIQNGDTTEIMNQTGGLETAQEQVAAKNSLVGARMASLEDRESYLATIELNNQTELSDIEDADVIEAITQLQQKQIALQASLQVTAMIDDLSLVNFL